MKILLISDPHANADNIFAPAGKDICNFGSKFDGLFEKLLPVANNYDLIVTLGDLIRNQNHDHDKMIYNHVIGQFDSLTLPKLHVIGNHDSNRLSVEELTEINKQTNTYFSQDIGEYHHVILNGHWDGEKHVMYDEEMQWLKNDLQQTDLPSIVYMHFPADEQDLSKNYYFKDHIKRCFIDKKETLRKILEESGKVIAYINGHAHFYNEMTINNIVYLTVPSFTEKDGNGKPTGNYIELILDGKKVTHERKSVFG